jgi:hypothetical protein
MIRCRNRRVRSSTGSRATAWPGDQSWSSKSPPARGAGLGRALVTAGRDLVRAGEPVYVQVAPGNVPSLRAVLAAGGFTPVGGEILFARQSRR